MDSNRKQDPRSWWHEEAKQMKRDGHTAEEIALKFGKNKQTVTGATRGVKRGPLIGGKRRSFTKDAGFSASEERDQIALRIPKPLMSRVNLVARMENKSVNSIIQELIEEALSFEGPKPRPVAEYKNHAH